MKTFKLNEKEMLTDFEVKMDMEFYILTAFLQEEGNIIQIEELESIKQKCPDHFSISSLSIVIQDSKFCLRVLILRNNSPRSIQVINTGHYTKIRVHGSHHDSEKEQSINRSE